MLAALVPSIGMYGCTSSSDANASTAPQRQCAYTVWHMPASAQSTVELVGDFENWQRPGRILPADRPDGWRVTRVDAAAGEHTYLLYEDGVALTDTLVPTTAFRPDGTEVSWVDVADCSKPGLAVSGSSATKDGEGSVSLALTRATSGAAFDPSTFSVTSFDGTAVHFDPVVVDPAAGTATMALHQLPRGKNTLTIEAKDESGTLADTAVATLWVEDTTFDLHDTITYQIMIDRFANAAGPVGTPVTPASRAGGDLAGVKAAIDAGMFSALGVNTLWLSPMYQNPTGTFAGNDGRPYSSYHGYWPSLPRTIEDLFGGEDALDEVIADAHAHDLRILFDVVPNHVHSQHPYAQEHLYDGWFNHPDGSCVCGIGSCDWTTHDEDCWFAPYLPDLSWMNPAQADQVTSDVQWWIDRFDGDGIRIDAVPNMPRSATRRVVNAIRSRYDNPGHASFLLGENFTGETGFDVLKYELGPFGLTSEFHFPLMYALRSAVSYAPATPSAAGEAGEPSGTNVVPVTDGGAGDAGGSDAGADDSGGSQSMIDIASVIQQGETDWTGSGAIMSTIIGNHDVTRFSTASSGDEAGDTWTPAPQSTEKVVYDKQIFALSTIFTLPGAPVIYYGDEVGLAGRADPDSRRVYPAESELSADQIRVRSATQKLGLARACSDALRRGDYRQIFADAEHLVFSRTVSTESADGGAASSGAGDTAIVTLSRLPLDALAITLPGIAKGSYTDLLSGASTTLDPELTTLDLTPFSVHVYVPSTSACAVSAAH